MGKNGEHVCPMVSVNFKLKQETPMLIKILKRTEMVLLFAVCIISIAVTAADTFGVLDVLKTTWIVDFNKLILLLLACIGLAIIANSFRLRSRFETLDEKAGLILSEIKHQGVRCFANSAELENYIAAKIRLAKKQICDLSWKVNISNEFALSRRVKSHKEYEEALSRVSGDIVVKEIFIFNDRRRWDKMKRRIEEKKSGYSCRYYDDCAMPRIQFIIIDDEVIFFAISKESPLCAVENPQLVKMLQAYFDETWERAVRLKDGPDVDSERIATLETELKNRWSASSMTVRNGGGTKREGGSTSWWRWFG
ncbi:hypothetical protein [Rhodoplanes sp. SY1]|uniref:hypothetical protein n=1 Tax=Rhodoplanes sp. SY1 TaxID=3166646 RepID=UPI0038B60DC2